jgi:hypothetical protein
VREWQQLHGLTLLLLLYTFLLLLLLLVVMLWARQPGDGGLCVSWLRPQLQYQATVSLQQHWCRGLQQALGWATQLPRAAAAEPLAPARTLHLLLLLFAMGQSAQTPEAPAAASCADCSQQHPCPQQLLLLPLAAASPWPWMA